MLFCDPDNVPTKCVWFGTAHGVDEDTEQRAGGEQANHEVGRGACSSTKTHLSGENILEREGGN